MRSDLLYRLRALFYRRWVEAELDEELKFHLDRQADKHSRSGTSAHEARRLAHLEFGGRDVVREECREARGTRLVEDAAKDARYALRTLRRSPLFTTVAAISLALGIGANAALFTVLNALTIKTLPVRDPQQLVELVRLENEDSFTYPLWEQVRQHQDVFSDVLAYSADTFDLSAGGEKEPVRGLYVSGDYFRTLGVKAIVGRTISPADDQRGAEPAAVVSYGFWQRRYGGDPKIVGRSIRLDNRAATVVGVAPRSFFGTDVGDTFDVAVPLTSTAVFHPADRRLTERFYWWLTIIGRLKSGVTVDHANARFHTLAPSLYHAALPPDFKPEPMGVVPAATGISDLRQRYGRALNLLMGMVGAVLLIACANVANLLLARAGARRKELAVRIAIGAGRGRLIRQLLTESVILALLGAAAGALLAQWGSRALVASISSSREARFLDLSPDLRVVAFLAGVGILTGMLFGLAPALTGARAAPGEALREGGRGLTERTGGWRLRRALLAAQIALSILLLAGAGLFVRSLHALLTQDAGFRSQGVLLVDADLRGGKVTNDRQATVAAELEERMRALPGVDSAGRSAVTPISGRSWQWDVTVDEAGGERKVHVWFNLVSPEYFRTMGTPVLAGRGFGTQDASSAPRVAIVSESAARRLFPGVNPIGRQYRDRVGGPGGPQATFEIVGIARDSKYRRLRDVPPPTVYLPIAQNPAPFPVTGTYALRFRGAPADLTGRVKEAVRTVDPRIALEFRLLSTQIDDSLLQERLMAKLAAFFGLLALALATVGVYGVVAYAAARRRREIGIRMALGATRAAVTAMVLRELAVPMAAGVPLGLAASLTCSRLVRTMLYGLTPGDPATLVAACMVLLGAAALASYLPARRAARSDPFATLREE